MAAAVRAAGCGRQILLHHAVAVQKRVDVQPHPTLLGVEGKHGPAAPLGAKRTEKIARSVGDRHRVHTCRAEGEEPGSQGVV